MNNKQQDLWSTLQKQNLVSGEYLSSDKLASPWFIKLLLAFSGWFASLFIFGFLLLSMHELMENSTACLILGWSFIAVAYYLLKNNPHEFLEHLMLATSLAGQALVAWALFENELLSDNLHTWLVILLMQTVLSLFMPHYVHRVCCAFFASIALVISFHYLHISVSSSACLLFLVIILVLNEWRAVKWQPAFEAISYGIILLLIPLKASYALGYNLSYWLNNAKPTQFDTHYWGELLLIVAMLYLLITLLQRSQQPFSHINRLAIIATTLCFCLLSLQASGLTVGLAILILGFSNSNKVLQGLGITALLYYISSYYYLLALTLLEKSGVLLGVGLFVLIIRYALLKFANPVQQGANDAV
ncbi:MAG: DUF4401 domain-containing protein [Psychromonas sp.]|nr:DUF4401 domain-containing protein [Alteromonadales bacterium]MCP5078725.1 DUF4401 domain-containing protein [Psychromonas sp.]